MSAELPDDLKAALEAGALGMPTQPGRIDAALESYFGDDETRTRASHMNLAVYTEDPGTLMLNHERLQKLTYEHACRALLIAIMHDSSAPVAVQTWITAHCHLDPKGEKSVCSEQASFLLSGNCQALVSNVVFSHLQSDLPLVMWWQGELTDSFTRSLYSRIDRLIVDSSPWENAASQFKQLLEALVLKGSRMAIWRDNQLLFHDLAYTRGYFHRLAIAHAFDDPRAESQLLPSLSSVRICYTKGHRTAAVYLAAWISTQLEARLIEAADDSFQLHGHTEFTLTIDEQDGSHPIEEISMKSPNSSVRVSPDEHGEYLTILSEFPDGSKTDVLPGPDESDESLVSEILMRGGNNLLLKKILPRFIEMIGEQPEERRD